MNNERALQANAISGFADQLAWTEIVKPELDKQVVRLYEVLKEMALKGDDRAPVAAGRIEGVEMVLRVFEKAISDHERMKPILAEMAEFDPMENVL